MAFGLPADLAGLSASDGIDPEGVILSWNASEGATSYEIYVATTLEGQREFITETSSTEAVFFGGDPGVIYYFLSFRLILMVKVQGNGIQGT